tara:strand:+ start:515 stop:835 length:321 start_codon:yes stop_codon:yes gene_type:complete
MTVKKTIKDVVEEQVTLAIQDKKKLIKKVTPLHDRSWYVKWVSSFIIIIAMALTALDWHPYNLFFHLVGVTGWGIVGYLWHDRALMLLNGIAVGIFTAGIIGFYTG